MLKYNTKKANHKVRIVGSGSFPAILGEETTFGKTTDLQQCHEPSPNRFALFFARTLEVLTFLACISKTYAA